MSESTTVQTGDVFIFVGLPSQPEVVVRRLKVLGIGPNGVVAFRLDAGQGFDHAARASDISTAPLGDVLAMIDRGVWVHAGGDS